MAGNSAVERGRLEASGALILGNDVNTMINAARITGEEGVFQILSHGTADNLIPVTNGVVTRLSAKQVARTMLESGFQKGNPVKLISCNTGLASDGFAYQLSRYLQSPVTAPNNLIWLGEAGEANIVNGGIFKTFFNGQIFR